MLIISLVFSILLLLVVNVVAWTGSQRRVGGACAIAGLGGFVSLYFLPSGFVMLNTFLVVLAGLACLLRGPKPGRFLKYSLAATVISYSLDAAIVIPEVREWQKLREVYPFESMADRLAYEAKAREAHSGVSPTKGFASTATDQDKEKSYEYLEKMESKIRTAAWLRNASLKRVHDDVVTQFVDSPGFGVGRRIRPSSRYLELPETDPIPMLPPEYEDPSRPIEDQVQPKQSQEFQGDLQNMHEEELFDFLNPKGFGYIRDRHHVAGFQSHQFRKQPGAPGRWQVQSIELVSLLKHAQASVYISEHFPRMDELRHAPTRPLDAFESQALEHLQHGEDLHVQGTRKRIRMLGSIRAVKQCLDCHEVQRGELLGAFSYKLRRDSSVP